MPRTPRSASRDQRRPAPTRRPARRRAPTGESPGEKGQAFASAARVLSPLLSSPCTRPERTGVGSRRRRPRREPGVIQVDGEGSAHDPPWRGAPHPSPGWRQHADASARRPRRAGAVLTVPCHTVRRTKLVPFAARPSVNMADWMHHVAYADRRDPRARRAAWRYSGFATSTARRQYRRGELMDDLVQVSHEALMLALQRFDPHRGTPFLAYAAPTIQGTCCTATSGTTAGRCVPPGARTGQAAAGRLRSPPADLGRSPRSPRWRTS